MSVSGPRGPAGAPPGGTSQVSTPTPQAASEEDRTRFTKALEEDRKEDDSERTDADSNRRKVIVGQTRNQQASSLFQRREASDKQNERQDKGDGQPGSDDMRSTGVAGGQGKSVDRTPSDDRTGLFRPREGANAPAGTDARTGGETGARQGAEQLATSDPSSLFRRRTAQDGQGGEGAGRTAGGPTDLSTAGGESGPVGTTPANKSVAQPTTGQMTTGQMPAGQPGTGQQAASQPATGQQATGQPATGHQATGRGDAPSAGGATSGTAEPPSRDTRTAEENTAEQGSVRSRPAGASDDEKTDDAPPPTADMILRNLSGQPANVEKVESPQPPPRAESTLADLVREVADRILVGESGPSGQQEVRIILKDEVLGGTEIRITEHEGAVRVAFMAGDKDAEQFLAAQQDQISSALGERLNRDVRVQVFDRNAEPGQAAEQTGQQQQQQNEGRSRNRRSVMDEREE